MSDGPFEEQISGLDFMPEQIDSALVESNDNLPKSTKISELPSRYDFRTLPEEFRKSDVIDTLISQNEELMGRLTIALRRAALMDEKVTDAKTEAARFKSKFTNATDQILVLKEQAKVLIERMNRDKTLTIDIDRTKQDLAEKLQVAEIRYAELYSTNQDRIEKYESILELYQTRINRFEKYRGKIKALVVNLREDNQKYRSQFERSEAAQSDLKRNIEETTRHIAEQAKANRIHAEELTNSYEIQLKEKNAEIEMLVIQNQTLGERSKEVDKLINEKARIENELIVSERRRVDLETGLTEEVTTLQKQVSQFRNENKSLAVELNSKTEALNSTSQALSQAEKETKALTDQVETLQMLWREQQALVEKLTNQKDSLQKLNKELSVSVNEHRREVRELKETIEATEARIQISKISIDETKSTAAKTMDSTDDRNHPDIISKIDKALSQLHIGR